MVCFTDDPRSAQILRYDGWFGARLALSCGARDFALITRDRTLARGYRLLILRPAAGQATIDLTELVAGLDLAKVRQLRFSSNGARLAVASASSFSLIDVPTRRVVYQGEGSYPSPSPSGAEVAFVNSHRQLALLSPDARTVRTPLEHGTTHSVGAWTPDGGLLFGLYEGPLALDGCLAAIDCATGRHADIVSLEEWNTGQNCALIRRRLLSPGQSAGPS